MAQKKKVYVYKNKKPKNHAKAFVVFMVVIAVVLAGVATVIALNGGGVSGGSTAASTLTPSTIMDSWQSQQSSLSSQSSSSQSQQTSASVDSGKEQVGAVATHDKPVPESGAVDRSYFSDALFIGDSRSEGFKLYSELDNATYFVYKGLSVETVNTKEVITAPDGTQQTVMNALKQKQFGKVYIMLGINELGWTNTNAFIQKYGALVDAVKKYNPNAIVYVQSILPVSDKKNGDPIYNNENINKFNGLIQDMVNQKQVYYVNPAESVMKDGLLIHEASTDGVHLNKKYCMVWRDYLMTHTVRK